MGKIGLVSDDVGIYKNYRYVGPTAAPSFTRTYGTLHTQREKKYLSQVRENVRPVHDFILFSLYLLSGCLGCVPMLANTQHKTGWLER